MHAGICVGSLEMVPFPLIGSIDGDVRNVHRDQRLLTDTAVGALGETEPTDFWNNRLTDETHLQYSLTGFEMT